MKIPFTGIEIRRATKQETSRVTAWSYTGARPVLASRSKPMLLSTVYRCVDLISDSVAVLPLKTYLLDEGGFKKEYKTHPAYMILDLEPNEDMTRFVFFKTLMASVLLTGNGYAYIERDRNLNLLQLIYIPTSQVTIVYIADKNGIMRKRYQVVGFKELVEPKDMIHVLNFSYDGIIGVSTLTHARQTLGIATKSEEHASGFFESGGAVSGILTVEGKRLDKGQKDQIYETWDERMSQHPNGIAVLEGNMKYQPITVSPKDSQLLESRQFNVVDICRFFSVSPVKAFDLSKSSYSTVEATQLQYLTDTALAVITKIEQEINRKVFLRSERGRIIAEFDTSAILRTDKAAQAAYWKDMFYVGAASPNEIRRENNLSRVDNGDKVFVPVNTQTLDNALMQKMPIEEEIDPSLSDNKTVNK
ncbi:phage portal protein [Bacteroides faecis]|uniref:phage portal protein n=1 Tax=Bacteroides faecis TaxID=674529 RepID=UPI0039B5C0B4